MGFVTSFAPNLGSHLMLGISDRILMAVTSGGALLGLVFEYVVYVVIALVLSAVAFHKKEMEF